MSAGSFDAAFEGPIPDGIDREALVAAVNWIAEQEGWILTLVDDEDDRAYDTLIVESLDATDFPDDDKAEDFLVAEAAAGSAPHLRALRLLHRWGPATLRRALDRATGHQRIALGRFGIELP